MYKPKSIGLIIEADPNLETHVNSIMGKCRLKKCCAEKYFSVEPTQRY